MVVVIPDENRRATQAKAAPARIVWMSEDDFSCDWNPDDPKFPLDFAIIHADVAPLVPFTIAEELSRIDDPVISAGWSTGDVEVIEKMGRAGGGAASCLLMNRWPAGPRRRGWPSCMTLRSLVATAGGRWLDRKGNLIGINGLVRIAPSYLRALAIRLGRAPKGFRRLWLHCLGVHA